MTMKINVVDAVNSKNTQSVVSEEREKIAKNEEIVIFNSEPKDNVPEHIRVAERKLDSIDKANESDQFNKLLKSACSEAEKGLKEATKRLQEEKEKLEIYKQDYQNGTVNGLINMTCKNIKNNSYMLGGVVGGSLFILNAKDVIRNNIYLCKSKAGALGMVALIGAAMAGIVVGAGAIISKIQRNKLESSDNIEHLQYQANLSKTIQEQEQIVSELEKIVANLQNHQYEF